MTYPFSTGFSLGLGLANTGLSMGSTGSRYFHLNRADSGINIPEVALSSDFMISFIFSASGTEAQYIYDNAVVEDRVYCLIDGSSGLILVPAGQVVTVDGGPNNVNLLDGKLHSVLITGNGDNKKLSRLCMRFTDNESLLGTLSDFKVYDAGELIRSYPVNDSGNTIRDIVSGQNGVIINGTAGDWGLFKEQPTLWKGQGLDVPPWALSDQELIKA